MSTIDDNDDDDSIGYGKPPKHSRFKKGQSGNPRGRKRREAYEETEHPLRTYLLEPMPVTIKGKKVKMPVVDVLMKSMINKALGGCHKTQKLLLQESGGLKALREEYKRKQSSADLALIEQVRREFDAYDGSRAERLTSRVEKNDDEDQG
jgi:hypothetical protein